jgi:hypothetical protein
MAPEPRRTTLVRGLIVCAALVAAAPVHAMRIVNYNILNYPSSSSTGPIKGSVRNPHFQTVLGPLDHDLMVVQEMQSAAGVTLFRDSVLNVIEPGEWVASTFVDGNDTDNALFYKPARWTLLGQWGFYPNPANLLRLVMCYRLRPVGYANTELRVYSVHLKASNTSADVAQRLAEATGLRDSLNAVPPGTHVIVTGDFNIYSGAEGALAKFLESQPDNDGRLYDPLNAPAITWNTGSLAAIHTQSPCNTCPGGWATGGLDDRFDMFLPTYNMNDGEGLDLIVSTYKPVGNDGLHYNLNMTDAPVIPEGTPYASALVNSSDHLPIRVDLQLPARGTAPGLLAFGTVITGAVASQSLAVGNTNSPLDLLDELTYTLTPSAGFTAPGGTLTVAEGAVGSDAIGMDTAIPGIKAGTVTVTSDDPDTAVRVVALTGTVLRHAALSLDSLAAVAADTLDFGTAAAGAHPTLEVRAHNLGFDALQAQLALSGATITGGAGRFTLTPAFAPSTLGAVGRTLAVAFDGDGATSDSLYEASLTLTGSDEPLPGALAVAPAVVLLRAQVEGGGTVAVGGPAAPGATALFAPAPNPLREASTLRFDLAHTTEAVLEVLDVGGRRVARVLEAPLAAGRYSIEWSGRSDAGTVVGAGLYFVRLSTRDGAVRSVRLAVVR